MTHSEQLPEDNSTSPVSPSFEELFDEFIAHQKNQARQNDSTSPKIDLPVIDPVPEQQTSTSALSKEKDTPSRPRKWILAGLICLVIVFAAGTMLRHQNDVPAQSPPSSGPENSIQEGEPTTQNSTSNPIENIASLTDSVLLLEVFDHLDNGIGTASGFLIRDNSTLITNFHVIENANRIIVKSSSGAYCADIADVLAYDEISDIAILQCDKEIQALPLELGNSDSVRQGNIVYAVGYPLGIANTLSNGIVSSRYTDEYGVDILQITTPISEGSSGGALLNESGAVVGVVCASYIDGQNMNIAITSNTVSQLLSQSQSAIDLKSYYSRWHPQVEFDEYDACIRMITLTSETLAQQVYDEWLSGDATEETLIEIMDAYGSDQGSSQLHTVQPGDFSDEVEQWCFNEIRRIGDIEIIEHDKGFSICYFCGAVERKEAPPPVSSSVPETSSATEKEPSHEDVVIPSNDTTSHDNNNTSSGDTSILPESENSASETPSTGISNFQPLNPNWTAEDKAKVNPEFHGTWKMFSIDNFENRNKNTDRLDDGIVYCFDLNNGVVDLVSTLYGVRLNRRIHISPDPFDKNILHTTTTIETMYQFIDGKIFRHDILLDANGGLYAEFYWMYEKINNIAFASDEYIPLQA